VARADQADPRLAGTLGRPRRHVLCSSSTCCADPQTPLQSKICVLLHLNCEFAIQVQAGIVIVENRKSLCKEYVWHMPGLEINNSERIGEKAKVRQAITNYLQSKQPSPSKQ
jgi:hypothetical protein